MIQGFDFEIVYVKGSSHTIADSLSRLDYPECTDSTIDKLNLDQSVYTFKADIETKRDELCLNALCEEVYGDAGNLTEMVRELVRKRISYLLLPGSSREDITVSKEGCIQLGDVCEWLSEDSGIIVDEADIQHTVSNFMQDKVSITNGMIHANKSLRAQCRGSDKCLLAQTTDGKAVRKHCLGLNAWSTHARPESAARVIGSAVSGSVTMDVRHTKLNAVAVEFLP